ncbi:unnamed protein product, partial [Owenia fusiformis]
CCLQMADGEHFQNLSNFQQDLSLAAANGDITLLRRLLEKGCDPNKKSADGMSPLAIAAFWGYAEIAQVLLEDGADVNATNGGTLWTPLHCAAFQGHGKVIMRLMEKQPNLTLRDNNERTAADFASALDSIWSFFAAAGCERTPKADLIKLNIVQKVKTEDPGLSRSDYAHFSRPGSAYAMRPQPMRGYSDPNMEVASITGDVLASMPEEPETKNSDSPNILHMWNN